MLINAWSHISRHKFLESLATSLRFVYRRENTTKRLGIITRTTWSPTRFHASPLDDLMAANPSYFHAQFQRDTLADLDESLLAFVRRRNGYEETNFSRSGTIFVKKNATNEPYA